MTVDSTDFVITAVSWVLCVISNIRYEFGRRSPWDHGHQDDVAFTPFTANLPLIVIYWLITCALQIVYLGRYFNATPRSLTWHFIGNNCLLLLWSYLFSRGHYFWSLVVVIIDFMNLAIAYILNGSYRIRPLPAWLVIHGGLVALPLQWVFYLIFWNGAVLFHARHLVSRLVANILIWDFLLVPGLLVLLFGDYISGFAASWIALALALGQLFTKVFALQWIFAFIIAGLVFIMSVVYSARPPPEFDFIEVDFVEETAPLITEEA